MDEESKETLIEALDLGSWEEVCECAPAIVGTMNVAQVMATWKITLPLASKVFMEFNTYPKTPSNIRPPPTTTQRTTPFERLHSKLKKVELTRKDSSIIKNRKKLALSKSIKEFLSCSNRKKSNERKVMLAVQRSCLIQSGFPLGVLNAKDLRKVCSTHVNHTHTHTHTHMCMYV